MRGVGRTIERIEHDDDVVLRFAGAQSMGAGFLAQHTDAGAVEDRERGAIGGQIAVVLTGPCAGEAPIGEIAEGSADGGRRVVQQLQQSVVVHVRATVAART